MKIASADTIEYSFQELRVTHSEVFNCSGTGIDHDYNCAKVVTNTFGYSSATLGDYTYLTVKNDIGQGKPVILSGGTKSRW
ncbi:hypothetical protein GCM10027051_22600 [Niabella terrae]